MTMTRELVPLSTTELTLAEEQDDVRGMSVVDVRDHRVGEVEEILVDPEERRARLLVIASSSIVGPKEHHRLVPVDAVCRVRDDVCLERSDLHVDSGFDYDASPRGPVDYRPVYSYFGYAPFWEDGYRAPYFLARRP
ncbi:PRC-barrel domain-containing protein [Nocardioides sp. zg-1230]|uniref:PRC-barrel domain-containing protein n=1 Tax=Nocardioides sp. zg-1230 TaxID=2736601 RepID=UPI00155792F0|nr:PRC-barrel domain-containing protein [Nocardioides sp. zg-1230]NPC43332.1 PRC-barrel domain-containing protein [Nocardioides sp. zg-1230]NPC44764.1 PRC-barrel domain-containing protein [Nocardioides sp. zg-1230]